MPMTKPLAEPEPVRQLKPLAGPLPKPLSEALQVDIKISQQDSAVERARYAMELEKDLPECFQLNLTKVLYLATLLLYE